MDDFTEDVISLVEEHGRKWTKIGEILRENPEKVRSAYRRWDGTHTPSQSSEKDSTEDDFSDELPGQTSTRHRVDFKQNDYDSAVASSISTRIKTLDDLIEAARIDTNQWFIKRWTANSWEQAQNQNGETVIVSLHQVKANLERNHESYSSSLVEDLREEARNFSPTYSPPPKRQNQQPYMLEVCIPDLHFGKYSWSELGSHYDMDEAERLFRLVVEDAAQIADEQGVEQILFPVGNDLFHVDNGKGTTNRGTPVHPHGDYREHYRRVRHMLRECIDLLHTIAPVQIPVIPGNHDRETMYHMGEALYDWYYNTKTVEVDSSPHPRKYARYGRNMIGYTHGNEEKLQDLPGLMAEESPAMWGVTKYREIHIGHLHHEKGYIKEVDEIRGTRVRVIPSISASDNWHIEKGYIGNVREARAFLWHKENGLRAQYSLKAD